MENLPEVGTYKCFLFSEQVHFQRDCYSPFPFSPEE